MTIDEEKINKEARKQKVYLILFGLMVVQVLVMGGLFMTGLYESNRNLFRIIVGVEVAIFAVVYLILRFRIGKKR